ncbi:MAG: macro domain-containing protein [Chloroflexota bacterium]|nr:macro domain-containing protein [Chloroflexota bacterium]
MTNLEPEAGVRFGRTTIVAVVGGLLDQEVDAVVYPANRRGVMGAMPGAGGPLGGAGPRTLGGSEIERQAMAHAPLDLGTALVTAAPGLEQRGVQAVIHAVIHRALGEPPRMEDIRRAIGAVIAASDRDRWRSVALPLLGIEGVAVRGQPEPLIGAIVDELVGCLRRMPARLDRVVITCRFQDHATLAGVALARARERLWVR